VSEHTPGPWTAEIVHSGDLGWRIVSDAPGYPNDGWMICGSMMGPQSQANARLISAAPEMLEALLNIVNNGRVQPDASMGGTTDICAIPLDDFDAARTAIAKAINNAA
jgi:hypothetical protein